MAMRRVTLLILTGLLAAFDSFAYGSWHRLNHEVVLAMNGILVGAILALWPLAFVVVPRVLLPIGMITSSASLGWFISAVIRQLALSNTMTGRTRLRPVPFCIFYTMTMYPREITPGKSEAYVLYAKYGSCGSYGSCGKNFLDIPASYHL